MQTKTASRRKGGRREKRGDGAARPATLALVIFPIINPSPHSTRLSLPPQVSVNDPLRFGSLVAYQTDWGVSSLTIRTEETPTGEASSGRLGTKTTSAAALAASEAGDVEGVDRVADDEENDVRGRGVDYDALSDGVTRLRLPMASLEGSEGIVGRAWGGFLPAYAPRAASDAESSLPPRGISFVCRDLRTVAAYDADGVFLGVRRPGSGRPLIVTGAARDGRGDLSVVIDDVAGATGLRLKNDPGIPVVYAGFALVMVSAFLSFLPFRQVWAAAGVARGVPAGGVLVGGRANRGDDEFAQEIGACLDEVPELN